MKLFKSAQQSVKKILRSNSPAGSDHQLDHQVDHSSSATHAPTSDNSASRSKSGTPTTFIGTQAGTPDIKDDETPVPTITVEECPTPLAPISTPSKRFVKTKNAQHDLVVLHVAYVLQKSSDLQSLILEIVRLSEKHGIEDIIEDCVGFTTRLIAALDSPTIAQADVEQAIVMFLNTIKTVDWDATNMASQTIRKSIKEIEDTYSAISTIKQKKDSTFSKVISKVLGVALPMLEIIKTGSSMIPVPMVQPLIGVVAGFLQAADQACNNFEWIRWLSITAAECVIGIAVRCPEKTKKTEKMEQAEQTDWTEAIDTLQRNLSNIVQQADVFCRRSVVSRFLQQRCDKGAIEEMKEDLKIAISIFNVKVGMNIMLDLEKMSRKIDDLSLTSLPRLKLPVYDFLDDRFQASREKEIEVILDWIVRSDDMRFFWINGAAGLGKSTLARRLLDYIKGEGILATFAYFSLSDTTDPKELVRRMARELSSLHPGCRPAVARAISECSGEHQTLDEYLTHFLVNPVDFLAYGGSLVIILDALDEWVHRVQFLEALRDLKPTLSLKFVMTSRPLEDIASIIEGAAIPYELTPVSDTVCRKYFEDRFNDPAWKGPRPDDKKLDKLVELAGGLLIWAATVCTVVSTTHPGKSRLKILDEILSSSLILGHEKKMKELYRGALERIFPAEYKESCLKLFLSMVVLKEDLPLGEFARLVDMTTEFIQDICRGLRALQTRGEFRDGMVQPAIKLFHASFIEHLCQLNVAHGVMVDNCANFLQRVTEPDETGPSPFEKAEQYIGKYWMDHLQEAPEKRSNFLNVPSNHLRLWVGCLLSHLFLLGDMYGYSHGSDALKSLSDRLVSTEGILSTPEMLWCDRSTTEMVYFSFQKALELSGIDYRNAEFYIDNPKDVHRWAHVLNGLAITTEQIQKLNADANTENLNAAINILKYLNAYAPNTQEQPFLLDNLGLALCTRFRLNSSLEDLTMAISLHTKARNLHLKDSHDYAISLCNLASTLLIRFKYGTHPDDLDQAISLLREVLELWPVSHRLRSISLNNLGNALLTQFGQGGQRIHLDQAICLHRSAVESTPSGHAGLPSFLDSLGNSYLCHFKQTGDLRDIDCAISHHQNAINSAPSSADLPRYFINLGKSYLGRFKHTGNLQDIDSAISFHHSAVKFTPSGHVDLPSFLNSLGDSWLSLFKSTRDLEDINHAISYNQNALESTPSGHADLPSFFNSLGNLYSCRFERTYHRQDIDDAISYHQNTVKSTPSGHADLPHFLNRLGNAYSCRFVYTGDLQDIDHAISHHQNAIESTPRPSSHTDLPSWFNSLGQSYRLRFQSTHYFPDIQNSIASYRQAAEANGTPSIRLESAKLAAMLSSDHDISHCLIDFALAIRLLSEIAGLEQTIHRRHVNLQVHGHSDLVGLAVATALRFNRVDLALEWLEQGRCVVWTQLNQLCTPIDVICERDPPLADCFIKVTRALQSYGSRPTFDSIPSSYTTLAEDIRLHDDTRNHTLQATEYRQLLKKIQSLPYFENLLQPLKTADLFSSLPHDGPIIIFNIHNTRCDALALIPEIEEPLPIPLENFSLNRAEVMKATLQEFSLFTTQGRGTKMPFGRCFIPHISLVLKELWYKVVQPILEALGYALDRLPNLSDRRRIWWCPTGPVAFLPLHAAGIYGYPHQPGSCVSDFVVSSYTPTVRSLRDKFIQATSSTSSQCTNLMLINQPRQRFYPPLYSTRRETRDIKVLMDGAAVNVLLLDESDATIESVKAGMKSHGWVHFACHGARDLQPLLSGLCLHDGRLNLLEIMKKQIPNADFAFLSASRTSNGDPNLSDEVVHFTAGMLAAGYRGVVGTMWTIFDEHGPDFATEFYKYLLSENGSEGLDSTRAAYALDYATRTVRERLEESPEEHLETKERYRIKERLKENLGIMERHELEKRLEEDDADIALWRWVPYVHFGY